MIKFLKINNIVKFKQMKKYYFSLILMATIVAAAITSCEKEDTAVGMKVSGTLEFSERYNDEITKVQVIIPGDRFFYLGDGSSGSEQVTLASGTYFNGEFSLELPVKVDDKYLDSHLFDEEFPTNIKVSDKRVKTGAFSFSTTNLDDTKENQIPTTGGLVAYRGKVYPLVYIKSDDTSTTEGSFYYANRKCSIIGTMTSSDGHCTTTYSVHLKRGWNIVYYTEKYMETPDKRIRIEELSTQPVSGLKWYVRGDE
jgi:hypothetical protein